MIGVKMLKMSIFFKLIVEIKKKTYISYKFRYAVSIEIFPRGGPPFLG